MIAQCFADAGLPAGVLNDLPGTEPEAGAALGFASGRSNDYGDSLDIGRPIHDAGGRLRP